VIDNDRALVQLITDLLEHAGHEVNAHPSWQDAYEVVRRTRPDLVILDLRLGDAETGWRVLDRLTLDPETRAIPVILCSGAVASLQTHAPALLFASGVRMLAKPFDRDTLLHLVESTLRKQLPAPPPWEPRPAGAAAQARPCPLTPRGHEVAMLVARGHTNAQIARELAVAEGTVANHVQDILGRLHLVSRAQISAWAVEQGLAAVEDRHLATLEQLLEIRADNLGSAMDQAAQVLAEVLAIEKVDLFLYEPASESLVAVGASDTPLHRRQRALRLDRLPLALGGRLAEVFRTGTPYLTGHADQDPVVLGGFTRGLGIRSVAAVALDVAGQRRGVVLLQSTRTEAFSERDLRFLQTVARWVGTVAGRTESAEHSAAEAAAESRHKAEELITIVAHDLRNHLTTLRGRLGLLQRRARAEQRSADLRDLAGADESVDRLNRLVTELLDVARLERGVFVLDLRRLNLAMLVQQVVDAFRPVATIRIRAPAEVPACADPDRLRQALENLLANAVEHSPAGAPVLVALETQTRDGSEWAVLSVVDRGPGIPPDLLPRLFERFVAGPGSSGLGLGLYLASRIAAAHGGSLSVDSRPGIGTSFTLSLPLGTALGRSSPGRASAPEVTTSGAPGRLADHTR
jgi:signal transduction histidine kinase/DNA-binding NarL/FixJ family response regulator